MDFQISDCFINGTLALPPSSIAIEGRDLGDRKFEPSIFTNYFEIWITARQHTKSKSSYVMMNCEFSLPQIAVVDWTDP